MRKNVLTAVVLLVISWSVVADYRSDYTGTFSTEWADQVAVEEAIKNVPSQERMEKVDWLDGIVQQEIMLDINNPVLWFLKGRINALNASYRSHQIKEKIRAEALKVGKRWTWRTETAESLAAYQKTQGSDQLYQSLKAETLKYYEKALLLDDKAASSNQLSGYMLTEISIYVFASTEMQIKALRKELNRPWTGGDHETEDDPVYNTYSRIVTAFVDGKRYDEALLVLDEMGEKYPLSQAEIEQGRAQIIGYQQTVINDPESGGATDSVSGKPLIKDQQTDINAELNDENTHVVDKEQKLEFFGGRYLYLVLGLFVILAIGIAVYRQRKSK